MNAALSRHAGLTLIDVLAAIVIVGILAALTYPLLQGHIVKSRRAQAQAALLEVMQQQERYFTQNNSYLAFSYDASDPYAQRFKWWSGATAPQSAYELQGVACPNETIATCIEVSAIPGTKQVDSRFRDPECETMSLRSTGSKQASGPGTRCWP